MNAPLTIRMQKSHSFVMLDESDTLVTMSHKSLADSIARKKGIEENWLRNSQMFLRTIFVVSMGFLIIDCERKYFYGFSVVRTNFLLRFFVFITDFFFANLTRKSFQELFHPR